MKNVSKENARGMQDDVISRQAAIDEGMSYINGDCFCDKEDFAKYIEFIEQLPPIQPEITHEQAVAYLQSTGWMQEHDRQMMLDGVHGLTAQPKPHWIPVAERLPKENYLDDGYVEPSQPVLVYMSYHTCKISRYWGHRKSKGTSDYVIPDWMDLEEYDGDNVIAWRELPESFKGIDE